MQPFYSRFTYGSIDEWLDPTSKVSPIWQTTNDELTTATELLVDLHLISADHLISLVGHADHRH